MSPVTLMMTCFLAQTAGVKLASPGLMGVNVNKDVATFYSDHLAQQLVGQGLRVITASEMSGLLGMERQKELLGCAESSTSCSAELANALGVDAMIAGSIGRFDGTFQINVKIIAATDGRTLSFFSKQVAKERDVLAALNDAAEDMAPVVVRAIRGDAAASSGGEVSKPMTPLRKWSFAPVGAGVAGIAMGAVFLAQAGGTASALRLPAGDPNEIPTSEYEQRFQAAKNAERNGIVCMSVGAAALAAGAVMFFLGADAAPAAVSMSASPHGAAVFLSGGLP
ncbi:MAG: hypothetical protein K1X64_16360 [Myxococcaceae bacterium]|nr:hypothetical protein [Myxococcaceae bacterium]